MHSYQDIRQIYYIMVDLEKLKIIWRTFDLINFREVLHYFLGQNIGYLFLDIFILFKFICYIFLF